VSVPEDADLREAPPWRFLARWFAGRPQARQMALFLAIGVSNTALTYLTYLGLLLITSYHLAYTGAFIVGLVYTGLLNIRVTFARHPTITAFAVFAVYYLLYYLLNLLLLQVVVEIVAIDERLALLVLLPVIVPINFFVTRLIAHRFGRARG
jgi:hypothetical protein